MSEKSTNRIVIVGWSARVPQIIDELDTANLRTRRAELQIVSKLPISVVYQRLEAAKLSLRKLRIEVSTTADFSLKDLLKIKLEKADSVILARGQDEDLEATLGVAIDAIHLNDRADTRFVIETFSAAEQKAAVKATDGRLRAIFAEATVKNLIAKSRRAEGLAEIYFDLLNFAGQEIYVAPFPALAGKTYGDAVLAFNKASVIGISSAAGEVTLSPSPTGKLKVDDKLIALAFDKYEFVYTGIREEISKRKFADRVVVTKKAPALRTVAQVHDEFVAAGLNSSTDLIDHVGACLASQLAETDHVDQILEQLLGAGGSSISIKPIEQYATVGKSVEFAQLVAVARTRSESVIGYRFGGHVAGDASTGVELNPTKTQEFTPVPGDSLIVIGNL
jgi:K+/H+ antiporter YhaU regulatory subunit KhtT